MAQPAHQENSFGVATEAARKTLRQLAAKRVAPTPDNYRQIYLEIVGQPDPKTMVANAASDTIDWGTVIAELFRQWEIKHVGWTPARKRDSLNRVLATPNPTMLNNRIRALIQGWSRLTSEESSIETAADSNEMPVPLSVVPITTVDPSLRTPSIPGNAKPSELIETIRGWFADVLDTVIAPQLESDKILTAEAHALATRIRSIDDNNKLPRLRRDLQKFWMRVDKRLKNTFGIHDGVLNLLQLLLDNVHELVVDDHWLKGQLDLVRKVLVDPEDYQLIEEAQRALKEVIFKQGLLKNNLNDAKLTLKDMVSRFIEQLGDISQSTGTYHDKLDHYSQAIRDTDDIAILSKVLDGLRQETRQMQLDTERSRDTLLAVRTRAEAADERIRHLEAELVQASELVREDQLTGVLNRRGLDDAFQRELSRSERNNSPLCIALLDIDNFKRLNDTYGHQVGDRALVHMVDVVKATVRPHDIIARYGGEEFLILLPDTAVAEAEQVIVRLQRSLTKHYFLGNNDRLLITFSAGISLQRPGESRESLVERADEALYEAKRTGKNRVVVSAIDDNGV